MNEPVSIKVDNKYKFLPKYTIGYGELIGYHGECKCYVLGVDGNIIYSGDYEYIICTVKNIRISKNIFRNDNKVYYIDVCDIEYI